MMQDFPPSYSRGRVLPGGQGLIIGLLAVFVAAMLFLAVRGIFPTRRNAQPRPVMARGELAPDETSTIELFRQASPSVVYITTSNLYKRSPLSLNMLAIPRGAGSGFVWDEQGHIVTNYHVLRGADRAVVTFGDGTRTSAQFVGGAADRDLAVLHIPRTTTRLVPIPVGSSGDLEVGQKVFAIGNPFGFDQTLTTGVISGLEREITTPDKKTIHGVIQTDAAINPGNSGGPLLDSAGRLIGINTAIVSPSGAYAGLGFAVPVDTINQIVPQLIRYGKAARPGLGVTCAPPHIRRRLNLPGVLVLMVREGGAADKAGMRPTSSDERGIHLGDIIVGVAGNKVASRKDLIDRIGEYNVGDTITVTVLRSGRQQDLSVRLQPEFSN